MLGSLVHVEIRINLSTKLPAFRESLLNGSLAPRFVYVPQKVAWPLSSQSNGSVLNFPAKKITGDVGGKQLRPQLMFSKRLGELMNMMMAGVWLD